MSKTTQDITLRKLLHFRLLLLLLLRVLGGLPPGPPDLGVVLRPSSGPLMRIVCLTARALQIADLLLVEYQRIHERVGHRVFLGQVLVDYRGYARRIVKLPQG